MERFLTLGKFSQTEIIIKKSKFIASATPVCDENEANNFIKQIKKEHSQATHNVFAYVINDQIQRSSDDGEPSGTAGRPMLEVINRKNLIKTAVVVTRYFGGIMLGAGGLVRAYTEATIKGIEQAGIIERQIYQQLHIQLDYQWVGLVKRELESAEGKELAINYGQQVEMSVYLLPKNIKLITEKLIEATGSQISIEEGSLKYL
ncbi:YigZ family protein [Peptococcaceae bacterium 1198_IL3148]